MDRRFPATATLALILAACSQQQSDQSATTTVDIPGEQDGQPLPPPPPPIGTPGDAGPSHGDGVNDGSPDLTPAPLTPDAERGEQGARNVLLSWGRALELKEWDQAWNLLSESDKARWPKPAWAKMFADLGKITVAMPSGTMEGAAGSSYYTAPVTITGSDSDGRPVRYEGEAVLRRVNDVPGASPAQLHWHFDHLTLDAIH